MIQPPLYNPHALHRQRLLPPSGGGICYNMLPCALLQEQSKSGRKAIFKAHYEKFRFLFEQFKHLRHAARGFNLIAHNHQSLLPLESTCTFPPEAPTAVWCRKMVSLVAMM